MLTKFTVWNLQELYEERVHYLVRCSTGCACKKDCCGGYSFTAPLASGIWRSIQKGVRAANDGFICIYKSCVWHAELQTEIKLTYYFLMQAYAKLTALFEKRMDSYANADARVSLEGVFPTEFGNTAIRNFGFHSSALYYYKGLHVSTMWCF